MSQAWEYIGPGRYALEFHGHVLQAIRNPERSETDDRPYIAVVDRVPLQPAEWSLARAKTKAMRHVLNKLGKPKPKGNAFQPDIILNGKSAETAYLKSETVADLPAPEPEPVLREADPIFGDVLEVFLEPEPAPSPPASPEATLAPEVGTLVITGTITNPDLIAGLNEIRSLLEMMREHAEVQCHINLPPILIL